MEKTMREEVAILLTTYNGEKYISEQIASIMNQTYQDFVCYVHDDGSTDHTVDILRELKAKYENKIVILEYPRQGCPRDNFLSMIEYVQSPYIMFSDQDDYWLPVKVEKTLCRMKEAESNAVDTAIAIFSDVTVVNENLDTIAESFYLYTGKKPSKTSMSELLMHNVALGCTMMINKNLYMRYKKIPLTTIPNHDWLFMLLAKACGEVYYVPDSLMLYRQHSNNSVGASREQHVFAKIKSIVSLKALYEKLKDEKNTIERQKKRAQELLNFDLPVNSQVKFLKSLKDIGLMCKWSRMRFYINNKLYTKHNILLVLITC